MLNFCVQFHIRLVHFGEHKNILFLKTDWLNAKSDPDIRRVNEPQVSYL
jgi:hypothetical protein